MEKMHVYCIPCSHCRNCVLQFILSKNHANLDYLINVEIVEHHKSTSVTCSSMR